jgi:hypothetical protein
LQDRFFQEALASLAKGGDGAGAGGADRLEMSLVLQSEPPVETQLARR